MLHLALVLFGCCKSPVDHVSVTFRQLPCSHSLFYILPKTLKPQFKHLSGTHRVSREGPAGSSTGPKQSKWADYRETWRCQELRARVSSARQFLFLSVCKMLLISSEATSLCKAASPDLAGLKWPTFPEAKSRFGFQPRAV